MPLKAVPWIYLVVGVLWIVVSDQVAHRIAPSLAEVTYYQTAKGWAFVFLSTVLLAVLTRHAARAAAEASRERRELFHETVEGAHHILRNYLNQMQLLTLEAERHREFDPEVLRLAREATARATAALADLSSMPAPTAAELPERLYPPTHDPDGPRRG